MIWRQEDTQVIWYDIWYITLLSALLKFVLRPSSHCMQNKGHVYKLHTWQDTVRHNMFTYIESINESTVHRSSYLWFSSWLSLRVDWWTKDFFSLTFLCVGTLYLLPEGNNLYSLCKTWLLFEVMFQPQHAVIVCGSIQPLKGLSNNLWTNV